MSSPATGAASEATLRRCLQATDVAAVDAAVAGWAGAHPAAQQATAAHAADRSCCRAPQAGGSSPPTTSRCACPPRTTPEQVAAARSGAGRTHLVAACDHASVITLGQVACPPEADKGGEVAAAAALAAAVDERGLLARSRLTVDAATWPSTCARPALRSCGSRATRRRHTPG